MFKAVIIDDEDLVREAVRLLGRWEEFGIRRIFEAMNAKDGLAIIDKEKPDLIITDMKMPVMNGVELLKELVSRQSGSPIIVVSGFSDFEYTKQAIRSKVVDYILKPIDAQDLNNAIATAVSKLEERADGIEPVLESDDNLVSNRIMSDIFAYIKENYAREITLEDLSHRFYASKEHISRTFKREYKTNLFNYITDLKIAKAKELLVKTSLSVEEIATSVGFSNGNYFSKAFKKFLNITPSEFRSENQVR